MKYTSKKIPNSLREVEVIFNHDEFLSYWKTVYDGAISNVHLKGFRPGAAPQEMADKAIDKDEVFHEAATGAVRDALKEITKENSWDIIDQPQVEILESKDGLKFKAVLTVFPEIKLGDYRKVAQKVLKDKKEMKAEDQEIKDAINWVLKSRAKIVKVDRPAQKGDVVNVVIGGKPDKFILGDGKIRDGIEEKIVGHKEGDKFDEVELKEVFERTVPELNEDFIKGLGDFKSVEEFNKNVREGITKEKEERQIEVLRLKMLDEIVKISKIDMPKIMVDKTLDGMIEDYQKHLHHLKGGPSEEELRSKLRKEAENRVAGNLVIYQLVKEENLEPSKAEVEEEANKLLKTMNKSQVSEIDSQRIYDYSYDIIKNKKVFEFLESAK